MHIPLTFQPVIKRLSNFFHFAEHTHKSASVHPLLKPTQLPSLYHLPFLLPPQHSSQHLLHQICHTTNSISFSRTSQFISPYLHHHHPSTLPSPSHLRQTSRINHPLSQLFINFSSLSTQTTYIPCPNLHTKAPIRLPVILQAMLARSRMRGLHFYGRQVLPTPTFWLVGAHNNWLPWLWRFQELVVLQGACPCLPLTTVYSPMVVVLQGACPCLRLTTVYSPVVVVLQGACPCLPLTTVYSPVVVVANVTKCAGKPAHEGRNSTSWRSKMGSPTHKIVKDSAAMA